MVTGKIDNVIEEVIRSIVLLSKFTPLNRHFISLSRWRLAVWLTDVNRLLTHRAAMCDSLDSGRWETAGDAVQLGVILLVSSNDIRQLRPEERSRQTLRPWNSHRKVRWYYQPVPTTSLSGKWFVVSGHWTVGCIRIAIASNRSVLVQKVFD